MPFRLFWLRSKGRISLKLHVKSRDSSSQVDLCMQNNHFTLFCTQSENKEFNIILTKWMTEFFKQTLVAGKLVEQVFEAS